MSRISAIQIENGQCSNACLFCSPEGPICNGADEVQLVKDIYAQARTLRMDGYTDVELSGHDPIEFKQIVGLTAWLRKIGFKNIYLATHGRNFCDTNFVKKISKAGLNFARVALYGSNAKVHDSITQIKGSFEETLRGLENIKLFAPEMSIELHTIILKENFDDLLNNIRTFIRFNPSFVYVMMPFGSCPNFLENHGVSYDQIQQNINSWYQTCYQSFKSFSFLDVPQCVLGHVAPELGASAVPKLSSKYSVPEIYRTSIPGLPSYRLKTKLDICSGCKLNNVCGGFIKDYVDKFDMNRRTTIKPLL